MCVIVLSLFNVFLIGVFVIVLYILNAPLIDVNLLVLGVFVIVLYILNVPLIDVHLFFLSLLFNAPLIIPSLFEASLIIVYAIVLSYIECVSDLCVSDCSVSI